jgi:hypothetical protein
MKLVFVHGINQQNKSLEKVRDEWAGPLNDRLAELGMPAIPEPAVPFYGDVLFNATSGPATGHVAAQGSGDPRAVAEDEAQFLENAMNEIAAGDARIDESEVSDVVAQGDAGPVGQGFPMHRRINAIVRVIERISPFHGDIALRVLKQAFTYLKRPGAGEEVDAIVAPHLRDGPAVIVAHSLGTIVSFRLLRRMALEGYPLEVPLFVTLGSPLSLRTVRSALGPKYLKPDLVGRWINAYDPDDFVALGQGLTERTFAGGIDNLGDIENIKTDAHSIVGYISDRRIAEAIGKALAG